MMTVPVGEGSLPKPNAAARPPNATANAATAAMSFVARSTIAPICWGDRYQLRSHLLGRSFFTRSRVLSALDGGDAFRVVVDAVLYAGRTAVDLAE